MTYTSVVISSGHGKKIRGASCTPNPPYLDEVDEARRVVEQIANELDKRGVIVKTYHDDVSKTQNENLNRIVDFHNAQKRQLDISVHFNAFEKTTAARGTEVLFVSQQALAAELSAAIASVGFTNRGAKKRTDLFFLNQTAMPSVLLEICFVDSEADAKLYRNRFDAICANIADVIGGIDGTDIAPPPEEIDEIDEIDEVVDELPPPVETPRINIDIEGDVILTINGEEIGEITLTPESPPLPTDALFYAKGTCSHFGGPDDQGVSPSEGLAFIFDVMDAPQLFLPYQPTGTSGLARRLNPYVFYVACRWDYSVTPKSAMLEDVALVRATKTGMTLKAFPADWGPHEEKTGRAADLSPGLMYALGIETDDEVEVIFPYRSEEV